MNKLVISTCLVAFSILFLPATPLTAAQDEWSEILRASSSTDDLIVLTNGSKLCGKIIELPPLHFSFGTVRFSPQEVAALGIVSRDAQAKVQYMTYDGQNYVGSAAGGKLVLSIREISDGNVVRNVSREIDPAEISFVLFAKTIKKPMGKPKQLHQISLQNGDRITAHIEPAAVRLAKGRNETTVDPQEFLNICFNGGLQGEILKDGQVETIGFSFVKDRALTIQIPGKDLTIRLPWDQIAAIEANSSAAEWPEEVLAHAAPVKAKAGGSYDRIGQSYGSLLTEAAGAIALPSQSVGALDNFGVEALATDIPLFSHAEAETWAVAIDFSSEPDPLFDGSEEQHWVAEIDFTNDPEQLFDGDEEHLWAADIEFSSDPDVLFDGSEEPFWAAEVDFIVDPQALFDENEAALWVAAEVDFLTDPEPLFDGSEEPFWAAEVDFIDDHDAYFDELEKALWAAIVDFEVDPAAQAEDDGVIWVAAEEPASEQPPHLDLSSEELIAAVIDFEMETGTQADDDDGDLWAVAEVPVEEPESATEDASLTHEELMAAVIDFEMETGTQADDDDGDLWVVAEVPVEETTEETSVTDEELLMAAVIDFEMEAGTQADDDDGDLWVFAEETQEEPVVEETWTDEELLMAAVIDFEMEAGTQADDDDGDLWVFAEETQEEPVVEDDWTEEELLAFIDFEADPRPLSQPPSDVEEGNLMAVEVDFEEPEQPLFDPAEHDTWRADLAIEDVQEIPQENVLTALEPDAFNTISDQLFGNLEKVDEVGATEEDQLFALADLFTEESEADELIIAFEEPPEAVPAEIEDQDQGHDAQFAFIIQEEDQKSFEEVAVADEPYVPFPFGIAFEDRDLTALPEQTPEPIQESTPEPAPEQNPDPSSDVLTPEPSEEDEDDQTDFFWGEIISVVADEPQEAAPEIDEPVMEEIVEEPIFEEEPVKDEIVEVLIIEEPAKEEIVDELIVEEEPVMEEIVEELIIEEPAKEEIVEEPIFEEEPVKDEIVEELIIEEPVKDEIVEELIIEEEPEIVIFRGRLDAKVDRGEQIYETLPRDSDTETFAFIPTAPRPVYLGSFSEFQVDSTPVTNGEYAQFVEATGRAAPLHWSRGKVPAGREGDPVVNVSYDDAEAYAHWAGCALPKESQWIYAYESYAFDTDENLSEWTSTPGYNEKMMVTVNGETSAEVPPGYLDCRLTFRTVSR